MTSTQEINAGLQIKGMTPNEMEGHPCEVFDHKQQQLYKGTLLYFGMDHDEYESGPGHFPAAIVMKKDGTLNSVAACWIRLLDQVQKKHRGLGEDDIRSQFYLSNVKPKDVTVLTDLITALVWDLSIYIRDNFVSINSPTTGSGMPWSRWNGLSKREVAERGIDPDSWYDLSSAIDRIIGMMNIEIESPQVEVSEVVETEPEPEEPPTPSPPAEHYSITQDMVEDAFNHAQVAFERVNVYQHQIMIDLNVFVGLTIRGPIITLHQKLNSSHKDTARSWEDWNKLVGKDFINLKIDPNWWSQLKVPLKEIMGLMRVPETA